MNIVQTDILILGSGGAGLFAAIKAYDAAPQLAITLATKGLMGKSGCTRMVQGGYNVAIDPKDSVEQHFLDTLKGGAYLNDQDLAWVLVSEAPETVHELETQIGCFFDRRPDGRIHQKAFAGQTFDRTIHRGDLTGIEIVSRLADQVMARPIQILEEHRALDLVVMEGRVVGALLLGIRSGELLGVAARAVLLATGGGPTMYKISAPSLEKTEDGMALAWRAGAVMRDMEMVQFHPTGLLAGEGRVTGAVLEEGLRGAGGYLYNALGERFMQRYDPERMERSTRDVVARASYLEIQEGRGGPQNGVFIDVSHLGADYVNRTFPGMAQRVREIGADLATGPVEVSPTAHFHMGGVRIDVDGHSSLEGLYVAGEDAGGVHGANRLGGNGVAESTVFGRRVGMVLAREVPAKERRQIPLTLFEALAAAHLRPWKERGDQNPALLLKELKNMMWDQCGLVRDAEGLRSCLAALASLDERAHRVLVAGPRGFNLSWADALNLRNLIEVSRLIAWAAIERTESRGSHYRRDYPERRDPEWLVSIEIRRGDDGNPVVTKVPVAFTRFNPLKTKEAV